jgi:hypothetical protein
MNRPLFPVVPILLGALLWQATVQAQPEKGPLTFSVVELEKFLGGRTLVTVDLKNATMTQVGAALSESTGLKIAPRNMMSGMPMRVSVPPRITSQPGALPPPGGVRPPQVLLPTPAPEPTFTLAATKQPFWEALRDWSIASRHAAEEAKAEEAKKAALPQNAPRIPLETRPTSVLVQRGMDGWELSPGDNLAEGRALSAWPFLLIGTDLRRTQQGQLNDTGLEEPTPPPALPAAVPGLDPDEKRWEDRFLFRVYALPDPKFNPTNVRFEVEEAIDEKGNDLRAPRGEFRNFSGSYGIPGGWPQVVVLASRPDMGKRLVKLRGTLRCDLVTRTHHWETNDLTKPVDDVLGGQGGDFKIGYKGMMPNGTTWKITFEAQSRGTHLEQFWKSRSGGQAPAAPGSSRSAGGIFDFTGTPITWLLDGREQRFPPSFNTHFSRLGRDGATPTPSAAEPDFSVLPADVTRNWSYTETYNFEFRPFLTGPGSPPQTAPAKLSFDFPVEHRQISVPFEFTDLPLPPSQWTARP